MKFKYILLIILLSVNYFTHAETPQPDDITSIENPSPPFDFDVINRLWHYIKKSTNAPATLPPPPITLDWNVPIIVAMGTQYPTEEQPNTRLQISIAPRIVDTWKKEMVLYGIGHELIHYVFLLRDNDWDTTKPWFIVKRKHHCDREFKMISKGIADQLWTIWHDIVLKLKMYQEINTSCIQFPQQ